MVERVLVTGGAGFIGTHVVAELLARGHRVRALDSLAAQVHGSGRARPAHLADVELVVGDVRDPIAVRRALDGVDAVVHLAARVGDGPSRQLADHVAINTGGTATLIEALIERPVRRLVVASSVCVYGEGLYRDDADQPHERVERAAAQLARGDWEPRGADGRALHAVPTPECKAPQLASIYALSKYGQERMSLIAGDAYRIPTVALRLFNVYGPHQVRSNPYSGVLAMMGERLLDERAPILLEDGGQQRDFVHVRDVARACRLALEIDSAVGAVVNVGSGQGVSLRAVAVRMAHVLGRSIEPELTGRYRVGDVRHCIADVGLAERVLGWRPRVALDAGLAELGEWLSTQVARDHAGVTRAEPARRELAL